MADNMVSEGIAYIKKLEARVATLEDEAMALWTGHEVAIMCAVSFFAGIVLMMVL